MSPIFPVKEGLFLTLFDFGFIGNSGMRDLSNGVILANNPVGPEPHTIPQFQNIMDSF